MQQPLTSPLVGLFLELVRDPEPLGRGARVADRVRSIPRRPRPRDRARTMRRPRSAPTAGNLLCRLPGREDGGTPIFLCAHLDTVPVDGELEPVVDEDGIVRNSGRRDPRRRQQGGGGRDARGGAADRRATACRTPASSSCFTPMEEVGLVGAGAFDTSRLEAAVGFVYDQAAPIGEIVVGAPHARTLRARFHGRPAHAGMYPEEGRSAILAAARAIADLRLGRIDEDSSRERRPDRRRHCPQRRSRMVRPRRRGALTRRGASSPTSCGRCSRRLAFAAATSDCTVETELSEQYRGYRLPGRRSRQSGSPARPSPAPASSRARRSPAAPPTRTSSTSAAFRRVNLANGMSEIHTPHEHIAVADLEAMVDVTLGLVEAARRAA